LTVYTRVISTEPYNIKFIYKDRKDIFVEADKALIIQVISNLLCNSIKFTNQGTVTISVEEKDTYQIVVSIGRSVFTKLLLGSVDSTVVTYATCNVMVTK
jgi:K+-sensing histidine kinase KdpD